MLKTHLAFYIHDKVRLLSFYQPSLSSFSCLISLLLIFSFSSFIFFFTSFNFSSNIFWFLFYFQFFSFSSNHLFQLSTAIGNIPAHLHPPHTNFSLYFSFSFSSLSICFLSAIHRLLTASKYLSIILLCREGDTNSGFVSFTASFSGHPCLVTELDLEN